jgi:hypothetical protein
MALNLAEFPLKGLNNIPAMARAFADQVEACDFGDIETVLVIIDTDECLRALGWGHADDSLRNLGMPHLAAREIADSI